MERGKFLFNMTGIGVLSFVKPGSLLSKTIKSSNNYTIEQFEDKGLAHFSYAVLSNNKAIIIDPQRDPEIYFDFAKKHKAEIVGVLETHPHADFVSSHLEIHKKIGVPIYLSKLTKSDFKGNFLNDGEVVWLSEKVGLRCLSSPGHAPDHISAILVENGKDIAVFSGDSLLIGDVGRPDLLDFSNESDSERQALGGMMYDTIHEKFNKLDEDVVLYPAHGAGSLCGKSIRKANSSTIGYEKQHNYAFEKRTKAEFVNLLLSDQPFIPKYFPYNVSLNIKGAPDLLASISKTKRLPKNHQPGVKSVLIDSRPAAIFKESYITNAINIPATASFPTWLGTVVAPESEFYLIAEDEKGLQSALKKAASIGYESKIKGAVLYDAKNGNQFAQVGKFSPEENKYTILDVRTTKEVKDQPIFKNSINIPLQVLAQKISELPTDRPILVTCASGFRSAIGSSILKKELQGATIYDLGPAVGEYLNAGSQK